MARLKPLIKLYIYMAILLYRGGLAENLTPRMALEAVANPSIFYAENK
jgi:hypothetical protein